MHYQDYTEEVDKIEDYFGAQEYETGDYMLYELRDIGLILEEKTYNKDGIWNRHRRIYKIEDESIQTVNDALRYV